MLPIGGGRRLRFVAVFLGSLHGKPQACVYLVTWRAEPEPQWRDENKSRGRLSPPTSGNMMTLPASFGQSVRTVPISKDMEAHLLILGQLRSNAADCIRLAEAARTSEHKSLFIEMAERWLTLAERAEKTADDRSP